MAAKAGAVNMTGLNIDRGMLHDTRLVYKNNRAMSDEPPDGCLSQYLLILYMYAVRLVVVNTVSDGPFSTGELSAAA